MFELYPISFHSNKKYTNQIKKIIYFSLFIVFSFFVIWFVRFSEPIKINKNPKLVDPVQYRL